MGWEQVDDAPVVKLSGEDMMEFLKWLSNEEKRIYRIPTEAEWEYACRAGTETHHSSGDDPASLQGVANVADRTLRDELHWDIADGAQWSDGFATAAPAGSFRPNAFGLHDMHGNVMELCGGFTDYGKSPSHDPRAASPTEGVPILGDPNMVCMVGRGGTWLGGSSLCRSAYRAQQDPAQISSQIASGISPQIAFSFLGFRVVCELDPPQSSRGSDDGVSRRE